MKTVVIASNNKNKIREFKSILNIDNVEFKSMSDIGFTDDIVEDGNSFKENALIKPRTISKKFNVIAISDDSGLEVMALGGAPGIYSARYAGGHDDEDNNALLLKNLKGVEDRRARYVCNICLYYPNDEYISVEEYCNGYIIDDRRGSGGFGYDPYFYVDEYKKTLAEVSLEDKNKISHRAKALRKLRDMLDEDFNIIR